MKTIKSPHAILITIFFLSILGGVLAQKAESKFRCLTCIMFSHNQLDPPTICTLPLRGITTVPNANPIVLFATTTTTLPCVTSTFYSTF